MTFERFDIVKVPFPFTDKQATKTRPALVISDRDFNVSVGQSVMAMITSAKSSIWLFDTDITDLTAAGLPVSCLIRMKLFTIDHQLVIKKLGRLSQRDSDEFERNFGMLQGTNKNTSTC